MALKSSMARGGTQAENKALTRQQIRDALAEGQELDYRDLARSWDEECITTLSSALLEAKWPTRVKAANSLMEIAHGRNDTREPAAVETAGIQVFIQNWNFEAGAAPTEGEIIDITAVGFDEEIGVSTQGEGAAPSAQVHERLLGSGVAPHDWSDPEAEGWEAPF